jgi:cyclic pyranopterin phosphate synthase
MSPLVPVARIPRRPPSEDAPPRSPRSVRVSVTDRCDFACLYCRSSHGDGYVDGKLMVSAWQTMFAGLRRAGVTRVRLTGGEPLLHPRLLDIVRHAAALGFEDLSATTNASQLAALARPLKEAGLTRVNVSLDTLDADRFRAITRGGDLRGVLAGIDAALDAGLAPVKLNMVVLRGTNDDEIETIVRWAWERRMVPRLLEVMPIGEGAHLGPAALVTASEMRARLASLVAAGGAEPEPGRGPAAYVRARHDPSLRVGFISGASDTFCEGCDRMRVSSTGALRPCLATDESVMAARDAERGDPEAVVRRVAEAWVLKPDGRLWRGCAEETARSLSIRAIGG